MSTQILIKKSTTPGSIPLLGDLAQGEMAINVADRRLYTNNGSAIVALGVYIDASAPSSATEGMLWYDTGNNVLKSYDGASWSTVGGVASIDDLSDVTLTSLGDGEVLVSSSGTFINQTLSEAGIAPSTNVSNWDTAFGWGDHSVAGYLTAEADTLDTVVGRGATTAVNVSFGNVGGVDGNFSGNVVVTGNLTVNGTTTTVNTTEVNIGDNIIVLNSDEAGTPSQNAGFEVERGTSSNVSFIWNETDDAWDLGDNNLQGVVLDGGTY